jgi:hypothetical protein
MNKKFVLITALLASSLFATKAAEFKTPRPVANKTKHEAILACRAQRDASIANGEPFTCFWKSFLVTKRTLKNIATVAADFVQQDCSKKNV